MDIAEIAQRSVEIVVAQGSTAVGDLVFNMLRGRQESEPAALALQENPGDPATQSAAAGALLKILEENRDLARMLESELARLEQASNMVINTGTGHTGVIQHTGTRNSSHIGDVNKNVTKRGGAFWGIVAAVVVVIAGGSTLVVVQNDSEPTLQEQAQKTAVDFANSSYGGDVFTMCGLLDKDFFFPACENKEKMQSAQEGADASREKIERGGLGKDWTVLDSKFPSDNRAIVTLKHTRQSRPVTVDMSHETGA